MSLDSFKMLKFNLQMQTSLGNGLERDSSSLELDDGLVVVVVRETKVCYSTINCHKRQLIQVNSTNQIENT